MRTAATLASPFLTIALVLDTGLLAQGDSVAATSQPSHRLVLEVVARDPESRVVTIAAQRVREFIAAGLKDGDTKYFMNEAFLIPEMLGALPVSARLYGDHAKSGRLRHAVVHLEYGKSIPWGTVFENLRIEPAGEDDNESTWKLPGQRLHLCEVKRPDGGYRLNFGNLFGKAPLSSPRLTTFTQISTRDRNPRLTARLRQMPLYARFDFTVVNSRRDNQEIAGFLGPNALRLAASITAMGNRPGVQIYSAMRPGEGLIGNYMDKKPRHARLVGALAFPPKAILATDLGTIVPRNLATLVKAAKGELGREVTDPVIELLEAWTGELTAVMRSGDLPAMPDPSAAGDALDAWPGTLEGTLVFRVEEDSASDIATALWKLFAAENAKKLGLNHEVLGEGRDRVAKLKVPGEKPLFLSFAGADTLLGFSIAHSQVDCLALRDGCLKQGGQIPTPRKFGMVQGAVKLWAHPGLLRVAPTIAQAISTPFRNDTDARADYIISSLRELSSEALAAGLSWNKRVGTMLNVVF